MHTIKIIILLPLVLLSITCKDAGTGPAQKPFKDPREMTWTADTLAMPDGAIQVLPEDILVVSPTDIWLATWVGHGQIMHYDGSTWKMVHEIGGGIDCLTQGSSGEIWAGGYIGRDVNGEFNPNNYIGNYNGIWQDNELSGGEILDVCTDEAGNIWACGRNGVILEYTKGKWMADTIKIDHYADAEYFLNGIESFNNQVCVITRVADSKRIRDVYHYVTGTINNWTVIDSMVIDQPNSEFRWGEWKLYTSNESELYSVGLRGIWKNVNSTWEKQYSTTSTIYSISVPSENYKIAVGDYKNVIYYDGNTWNNFFSLLGAESNDIICRNVWTDGYEILIVGYGTVNGLEKTIIWHGK